MHALIIVHPEESALSLESLAENSDSDSLRKRFDTIATLMEYSALIGSSVYCLGESKNSSTVYEPIRRNLHLGEFIPMKDDYLQQYIIAKSILIHDGIRSADIVGVSYGCCVKDLYSALINSIQLRIRLTCESMGLKKDEIRSISDYRVNACIIKELTDRI